MNLRRLAHKLQTALCLKGQHIKINQMQAYSQKAKRMVTKYVVIRTEAQEDGHVKNSTLLETYQLADVVKRLADLYGGG